MGALAQNDKTVVGLERMLAEWRADAALCADVAPISMADSLGGESGARDRRCLLYSRGPLVLHMLRTSIGDKRFIAATKKFLDTADRRPASTDDYVRTVSGIVEMDMGWFFDQWFRGTGIAHVDVEHHVDAGSNGEYHLWGVVKQTPGAGFKKLLVPLVWQKDGEADGRVVFADEPEKKFAFVLPFKPGSIKPDPYQNNLASYK